MPATVVSHDSFFVTSFSLGIAKMWSTIFSHSKLTEILGNLSRIYFIKKTSKLLKCLISRSIWKIQRQQFEKLIRLSTSFFDALHLSIIGNQRRFVAQFSCLLGHSVVPALYSLIQVYPQRMKIQRRLYSICLSLNLHLRFLADVKCIWSISVKSEEGFI